MPDHAEPTAPPPNPPPEVSVPGEPTLDVATAHVGDLLPGPPPRAVDYAAMLQEMQQRFREAQQRNDAEMWAFNAIVERQRQMAPQRAAVAPPPPNPHADLLRALEAAGHPIADYGLAYFPIPATQPSPTPKDQAAEDRAYTLLVGEIGEQAAARLKAGGAYPIPSKLWPGIIYLIPRDGKVRILDRGRVIGESCIVTMERVPWPDVVLTRIQRIRDDETIIFSIGIVNT